MPQKFSLISCEISRFFPTRSPAQLKILVRGRGGGGWGVNFISVTGRPIEYNRCDILDYCRYI